MSALDKMTHKDAQAAFNEAIQAGRLSDNPMRWNFAGAFMYMGTWKNLDQFKHSETRRYLGAIPLRWEVIDPLT